MSPVPTGVLVPVEFGRLDTGYGHDGGIRRDAQRESLIVLAERALN